MATQLAKLNQYIPVDLLRDQDETIDIRDKFKGRVGDVDSYIKLWVYSNSLPQDMTGWRVLFQGTDFQHNDFRSYMKMDDSQQLDMIKTGRITLYFDANIFQCDGQWEQAYFSFISPDGKIVSTVNILLVVMGSNFYARMGAHAKSVIEEFQELVDKLSKLVDEDSKEVNDKVAQLKADLDNLGDSTKKDFTDWLNKYKQALSDAMAEINDPKDGLYIRYKQLLDMTKQIQETLKQAQFHDRPFQLKTVADMKSYTPLIAGDVVITQGWDNYDDGHGGYWNVRVKHKDEIPDEVNVISLDNGMVAERNSSLISADSLEDLMYGYSIKIVHNQAGYPVPHIFYYEDAIGTETNGLGTGRTGFGQNNTKYIPCEADYPDANTIVVRIPRNFYLKGAPSYKAGGWYIIDENRTIKIDLGNNINDTSAQSGDGKGSSYLSAGTGYFSKPTKPSDLRAVYVDEHTQRLLWRD
ncbi:DUF2479 domain-containing protein [Limosilactobacillus vaginalis]|uniref:DUF2479 domain-containing protein n=1 Tax=Limosilactobacillus vaginalis TaxID=1633 RepID=UPI0020740BE9|nr:DUF2479 domain-containing protein [Limosilactobacillus vaginalis]